MANKVRLAHSALEALLTAHFPGDEIARNPAGHKPPRPRAGNELASYLALIDDINPEVLATLSGPVYDLKVTPQVVLAFHGRSKDDRQAAAYARLDALIAALKADPTLGGAVDYADIEGVDEADASDTDWLAGGLDVRVGLLLTAPTKAG